MKRFKIYLTELFDKPLQYKWLQKKSLWWEGSFHINDHIYEIDITKEGNRDWAINV